MINFRKAPLAAALLVSLTMMYGCDSGSSSGSRNGLVENDETTDVVSDSGDGTGTESGTAVDTESGTAVDTESGTTVDTESGAGNDTQTSSDQTPATGGVDTPTFEARYSVRFVTIWSAETHPINFPDDPHFSPLTGAVHNEQVVFWQPGGNATDGIEDMAETGGTGMLLPEIRSAIDQGYAQSSVEGGGISTSPGENSVNFVANRDYPLLTLVSMLAPSPDWFIGINSLSLLDANGAFWDSMTIELNLYDAGTDGGLRYSSPNEDIPRSPIALVNSFPFDSDFLEGRPSVGRLEITRMP